MGAHYSTLHIRQSLKSLGFSDSEIKILNILFHHKEFTAREISKESTIAFSSVQYYLSKLISKGLITCTPGEEEVFKVCSEQEFLNWIDEQKNTNQSVYDQAKLDIHAFLSDIHKSSWKPEVMYYEGKEGIVEIYEDMLQTAESTDKNIYSWIDIEKTYEMVGADYVPKYIKKRTEKCITSHDILPKNEMTLKHAQQNENREIKFAENFPIEGDIRIYGDKVAVITFDKKKPVGFVFQGSVITKLFRTIFDNAWDNLK